jgi:hypothetical protein
MIDKAHEVAAVLIECSGSSAFKTKYARIDCDFMFSLDIKYVDQPE